MEDIVNSKSNTQPIAFARVSANNGIADIKLNDWRSLDTIEALTQQYIKRPEIQAKLEKMANHLAEETFNRRQLVKTAASTTPQQDLTTTSAKSLSWLAESDTEISPLPSPAITITLPGRSSQHTASLHGLSPLDASQSHGPSPISPLTTTSIRAFHFWPEHLASSDTPTSTTSQNSSSSKNKHKRTQSSHDLCNDPTISPVLLSRKRGVSVSMHDLLKDLSAIPGMSTPSQINEKRFSNVFAGDALASRGLDRPSDEAGRNERRKTTLF